ncbi:MAG: LysR family transcriptional regulator [Pseudomonadota bacterium]
MDQWDEIRTAAEVARLGTISAAAKVLGVHRATVNRHIDYLEKELGAKLFLRHARGFTPTELGLDLLRVAEATKDQFGQLQRRAQEQSHGLTGELLITSLDVMVADIFPAVALFQAQHPHVLLRQH